MNWLENIGIWGNGLTGSILPFLFNLTIVIFFHELGHFVVARWCGVRVLTFSIGFGPELIGFNDNHGTRWKVSAIPLGGYVKFLGAGGPDQGALAQMSEAERRDSFSFKPAWRRAAIVVAGPVANFILAIAIFATLALLLGKQVVVPRLDGVTPGSTADVAGFRPGDIVVSIGGRPVEGFADVERAIALNPNVALTFAVDRGGVPATVVATPQPREQRDRLGNVQHLGALDISGPTMPARVVSLVPRSAAAAAGFAVGDRVRAIDGRPVASFNDLRDMVGASPDKPLDFEVDRDGRMIRLHAKPVAHVEKDASGVAWHVGQLGISGGYAPADIKSITYGPLGGLSRGFAETWFVIDRTLSDLRGVIVGRLGGLIGIAQLSGQVAAIGFVDLIHFAAVLSISIGLLNLLPIPLLDGGHLSLYAIEAVRGRPLSERVHEYVFRFGFAIVLLLMFLATYNDVVRLFVQ